MNWFFLAAGALGFLASSQIGYILPIAYSYLTFL